VRPPSSLECAGGPRPIIALGSKIRIEADARTRSFAAAPAFRCRQPGRQPGTCPERRRIGDDDQHHLRHYPHLLTTHAGPFGNDRFGLLAERFARFFGTPQFIIAQTVLVAIWIAINAIAVSLRWDPYPFILLNLAFSTQAAYAAPLILLAATRQSDRDKLTTIADAKHREAVAELHATLLRQNTDTTELVRKLAAEIHAHVC
jgi:uncharacterized membrane protein